jgi:hypothetical protein
MANEINANFTTASNLYAVVSQNGQFWNASTAALEAYDGANWTATKYCLAMTELATGGSAGFYQANFPTAPAGDYAIWIYLRAGGAPAVSDTQVRSGGILWNGTAEIAESDSFVDVSGLEASVTDLETAVNTLNTTVTGIATSGIQILPVSATVSAGEVRGRKIVAYQYSRLGPWTFSITDSNGKAVDLDGHDISFVVGDTEDTGTLWQVDGCAVGGPSDNQVTVSQDDTNTGTAGEYKYALRDLTNDSVIARGELTIVPTPDAD